MKKVIAILLAALTLFNITACGGKEDNMDVEVEAETAAPESGNGSEEGTSGQVQYTDFNFNPAIYIQNGTEVSEEADEDIDLAPCKVCLIMPSTVGSNIAQDFVTQTLMNTYADDDSVTINLLESLQTADWETNLLSAATGDYDLIIGFAGQMKDMIIKVAEQFPDKKFVAIDNTIIGVDNVCSVAANSNEGSYIAGYCAAMLTSMTEIEHINEEKKIAFIGGKDTPYALDAYLGFAQGAAAADPEVEVLVFYGDSFIDPMGMKEMALAAAESGCDACYAIGGSGLYGVLEGCQESGIYYFGFDGDYDEIGKGYTVASYVRNLAVPTVRLITDLRKGEWHPDSVYLATFSNGGMGMTDFSVWAEKFDAEEERQEIIDAIIPCMEKIADGEVLVDEYPDFRAYDRNTYSIYE